jgi:hypothetical protein
MLSVIMLSVIMLSVIMLSVIMLNVIMPSVIAHFFKEGQICKYLYACNFKPRLSKLTCFRRQTLQSRTVFTIS